MNLSRRKALGLLGAIPVVGPAMAAKLQNEANAGKFSNLAGAAGTPALGGYHNSTKQASPDIMGQGGSISRKVAINLPWFREELETLMAENHRYVNHLDPDLAVLRSISLSAKIVYQRKRNIARAMQNYTEDEPWEKLNKLWARIPKIFG